LVLITATAFGIALDIFYVIWSTTVQQNVPSESLSRVTSYDTFGSFLFGPLGIAIAGPVAVVIGTTMTMNIAAAISLVAVVGSLLVPSVRNLEAKYTD
jgi:hypothetical protein